MNTKVEDKINILVQRPSRSKYEQLLDDEDPYKIHIYVKPQYTTGDMVIQTNNGVYDILPDGTIRKRHPLDNIWNFIIKHK